MTVNISMLLVKDIVHVNAIVSFAAVSLEIKFTKLLFLVWHNVLMLKLALVPLQEKKKNKQHKTVGRRQDRKGAMLTVFQCRSVYIKVLLLYLDASTLQKILADVSAVVLNCVLIYELLAHN